MITHRNLIGFKPNRLYNSPLFIFRSVEMIWQDYCRMVLLFVAVCWCRVNRYKPSKWTFFQILHQNRVQNIFQYHDNNIKNRCVLKKYIIVPRPIFNTTYKGKRQVEICMWALHHELVLFLQSRNWFCYVAENETEG